MKLWHDEQYWDTKMVEIHYMKNGWVYNGNEWLLFGRLKPIAKFRYKK